MPREYSYCANQLKSVVRGSAASVLLRSLWELQYLRPHYAIRTCIFRRLQVIHMHIRVGKHCCNLFVYLFLLSGKQSQSLVSIRATWDAWYNADSKVHTKPNADPETGPGRCVFVSTPMSLLKSHPPSPSYFEGYIARLWYTSEKDRIIRMVSSYGCNTGYTGEYGRKQKDWIDCEHLIK